MIFKRIVKFENKFFESGVEKRQIFVKENPWIVQGFRRGLPKSIESKTPLD